MKIYFTEDIQIRFYEEKDNQIVWEGFGEFQPSHVHKQVAISFRTPRYKTLEVESSVRVNIQLRRLSDGATSEPRAFELYPLDSGRPGFWSLRKALAKKGNYSMFTSILASNAALLTGPNSKEISWESTRKSLKRPPTEMEEQETKEDIKIKDEELQKGNKNEEDIDDYTEIPRWEKEAFLDANANIETSISSNKINSADLSNSNENSKSLNELITQVAELDDIYSDARARIISEGINNEQLSAQVALEVQQFYNDDSQTYSSLQMAMKNPVELLDIGRYEDINPRSPLISIAQPNNKRDNLSTDSQSNDNKLPPLPPKRAKKIPPTPPIRPDHLLNPDSPPEKNLPPTPESVNKFSKGNIFTKLFSKKKGKKDIKSLSREGSNENIASGLRKSSAENIFDKRSQNVSSGSLTSRTQKINTTSLPNINSQIENNADLTEAEHYALYTSVAPQATASEFDEMSFYYSPVEGGKILTSDSSNRLLNDIYT